MVAAWSRLPEPPTAVFCANDALALAVLQAAVDRTPRSVEARRALGELLLSAGELDSVRDQYREVLRRLGEPLLAFRCGSCRARFRT